MRRLIAVVFAVAFLAATVAGTALADKSPGHGTGSCGQNNDSGHVYHQGFFVTHDDRQGNDYSTARGC